jgi:hypothetical protein
MEAHLLTGAAVEPGAPVFTVADLSVIDVVAEVPERSLPLVRTGQRASVRIAAFPAMRFEGEVERLRDALNPETRTVRAVIHVPNSSRRLRPGMFATVQLAVATRDALALASGGADAGAAATWGVTAPCSVPNRPSSRTATGALCLSRLGSAPDAARSAWPRFAHPAPPPRALWRSSRDGLRAGEASSSRCLHAQVRASAARRRALEHPHRLRPPQWHPVRSSA